jgi:HD-like signal output (HDOD) protein
VQLLDDTDLVPEVALQLTALADSLPRPRSVMLQLVQAGDDPAELARVVATDPATAALLLRTVNSAQFNLTNEITSVQHAITYLGANLVRDVAMHHAMAVPVDTRNLTAERIYQALWRNSYLASGITLALAQRLGMPSPSVLSTQALLYRLGDIALVSHRPGMAAVYNTDPHLADLVDQTQQQLGFNSAMVGAHLAQTWGLPAALWGFLRRSLAPLAGGPQTLTADLLPGVTLGYFSTRLAQALSRQVDFDLPAALQDLLARPEAHYLPQYLAAIGLLDPLAVLSEPGVERRLAALASRR